MKSFQLVFWKRCCRFLGKWSADKDPFGHSHADIIVSRSIDGTGELQGRFSSFGYPRMNLCRIAPILEGQLPELFISGWSRHRLRDAKPFMIVHLLGTATCSRRNNTTHMKMVVYNSQCRTKMQTVGSDANIWCITNGDAEAARRHFADCNNNCNNMDLFLWCVICASVKRATALRGCSKERRTKNDEDDITRETAASRKWSIGSWKQAHGVDFVAVGMSPGVDIKSWT